MQYCAGILVLNRRTTADNIRVDMSRRTNEDSDDYGRHQRAGREKTE